MRLNTSRSVKKEDERERAADLRDAIQAVGGAVDDEP